MTEVISGGAARRRYLALLALRWFPVGLWIPLGVLLALSQGLSLAEAGLAASCQGFVVLALELPTGGMSDSWGRRPVLVLAAVVGIGSTGLLVLADTFGMFAAAFVLQGVFRALDSGPLQSWYVDATLAADPAAKLERGLSAGGTVTGIAIGAGALASGGIVAWLRLPGVPVLVQPLLLSLLVQVVALVLVLVLVVEAPHADGDRGFVASLRAVPSVIVDSIRLVRASDVLACLILVELTWGFGMITFETLMPVRMSELVGGEEAAAAITGPVVAVAWLVSAAGAAAIPLLTARIGVGRTGALLRVAQGVTVLGMGLLAGPVGLVTGYLATYLVHGASDPVHSTLLHREVTGERRTTVLSLNSMMGQASGAIGLIVLTVLASGVSTSFAMVVGAVVLALAAPLYLPAVRAERRTPVSV